MAAGVPFFNPINKPLATLVKALPLCSYQFFLTGTLTQALVYRDAFLKLPYNGQPQADDAGNFDPIYLDPRTVYRVRLVDLNGGTLYTLDNYVVPCPSTGTGPINVNPVTGEVQINPPGDGGNGNTLTVTANNTYAVVCLGNASYPGSPLLQFINTLTEGKQTANFAVVANKPGATISPFPTQWLPILGDGGITYYIPLWE